VLSRTLTTMSYTTTTTYALNDEAFNTALDWHQREMESNYSAEDFDDAEDAEDAEDCPYDEGELALERAEDVVASLDNIPGLPTGCGFSFDRTSKIPPCGTPNNEGQIQLCRKCIVIEETPAILDARVKVASAETTLAEAEAALKAAQAVFDQAKQAHSKAECVLDDLEANAAQDYLDTINAKLGEEIYN